MLYFPSRIRSVTKTKGWYVQNVLYLPKDTLYSKYMKYKEYTVADFRKNTRRILNEALKQPIAIVRYDERFTITNAANKEEVWPTSKDIVERPKDQVAYSASPTKHKETPKKQPEPSITYKKTGNWGA